MNRGALKQIIQTELARVSKLFNYKNDSYGDNSDAFYNFRQTAERVFGNGSHHAMFITLLVLADKHWVTLAKNGIDDKECEERLRDMIVYCLIGLAMQKEAKGNA